MQQRFALALESEAPDLFLELAELMPSAQQRMALLEAAQQAGWRIAGNTQPLSSQVRRVFMWPYSSNLMGQGGYSLGFMGDPGRVLIGS